MWAPRWAVWSIAVGGPLVVASSAAAVARWRGQAGPAVDPAADRAPDTEYRAVGVLTRRAGRRPADLGGAERAAPPG